MAVHILPADSSIQNLAGRKFGRWAVESYAGSIIHQAMWNCVCECGKQRVVSGTNLERGGSRSCGCLRDELAAIARTTHGKSGTPTHATWKRIIGRCTNPKNQDYPLYGGRGIAVCDRWRNSFENFLEDMGERPVGKYSIGRIDNNGNYEPSNCRWETDSQQMRNRKNTIMIDYRGEKRPLAEWCEIFGLNYKTTWGRICSRGMSPDSVFAK